MVSGFRTAVTKIWLWPVLASLLLVAVSLGAYAWFESGLVIALFAGQSIVLVFLMTAIFSRQRRLVQVSDANLLQARDQLEDRVARRTTELQLANAALRAEVHERRQAEDAVKNARQEAELANRVKSEFLATMSHEIRTPMNGIMGMVDLLLETPLDPDQLRHAETIKHSGDVLLTLLNDILDLSKIEADMLEMERIDFTPVGIISSISMLWAANADDKGLYFRTEFAVGLPEVLVGDPTRLRQILFNFVSNAIKFTETGGISLTAGGQMMDDGRFVLRVAVRDTGIGVDPAVKKRLFEPFTQADASTTRKYGGSGLGLSICKKLSTMMGGEIGCEDLDGQGSMFWMVVPCAIGDRARLPKEPAVAFNAQDIVAADRPLKILVAEDNEINQTVVQSILLQAGHEVAIAHDGGDAIVAVREHDFDIILMDVQMPRIDGPTATKWIREMGPKGAAIPIIAVTANAMSGDRERYLRQGMDDYVAKPIQARPLCAALARQMRRIRTTVPPQDRYRARAKSPADGRTFQALDDLLANMS
jgi:signal transduction histidine kinase/FixJ family two-component response regulator